MWKANFLISLLVSIEGIVLLALYDSHYINLAMAVGIFLVVCILNGLFIARLIRRRRAARDKA